MYPKLGFLVIAGVGLALLQVARHKPDIRAPNAGPRRSRPGGFDLKDLPPLGPENVARLREMGLPSLAGMKAILDGVKHSNADNRWSYSGDKWAGEGAGVEEMWPHLCPHPVVLEKEILRDLLDAYASAYKDYLVHFGRVGAKENYNDDSLRMRFALYRYITADAAIAEEFGRTLDVSKNVRKLRARHQEMQATYMAQKRQVERYLEAVDAFLQPDIPDPADRPVWSDYIDSRCD